MTMQPVAALPIDAPLWWIVYLRGSVSERPEPFMSGIHFGRKVPNPRLTRMVIVKRDGGNVSGVFDRPRVKFDIWAGNDKDASDIAATITAIAFDAPGTNGCTRVRHLSGPLDIEDPSKQPRQTVLIEATHRTDILAI